jgi:putative FmdB family regulatory protein
MPIYEYECTAHGSFETMRQMAESSAPAPCPQCARSARRIISAPNLQSMARSTVRALDRNEKNRHEPAVSTRPRAPVDEPRARVHTGPRPWVIEHG